MRSSRIISELRGSPNCGAEPPAILSPSRWRRVARRSKREVLERLLGGDCAGHPLALSHGLHATTKSEWRRFRRGNLVGIGFGAKETEGSFTGDLAVRVYVKRKLPRSKLSAGERLPAVVNGTVTDIIAIGTPRFHARPVKLGAGISHVDSGPGSLGCIVTKQGDDGWYLLSACHVLAPAGLANIGDAILEPSRGQTAAAPIANLADFEALKADGTSNMFDAAIARLIRKEDVSITIPKIGIPQVSVMEPALYQSVRKFGARTLHTVGVVTDPMFDTVITRAGKSYLFDDIVAVTGAGGPFSEGGDSGALVVDATSTRPVGLVIGGGAEDITFLSPIGPVLERFNVQLSQ